METSLPAKTELVLYAPMSDKQRELNDQLRDKTLMVRCCFFFIARCAAVVERTVTAAAAAPRSRERRFRIFRDEKPTSCGRAPQLLNLSPPPSSTPHSFLQFHSPPSSPPPIRR